MIAFLCALGALAVKLDLMARDLTNKVILITGASSGIGQATAIACAQAGMRVSLIARRADKLQQVALKIAALGHKAHFYVADSLKVSFDVMN